jgi:hypothetical protein
MPTIGHVTGYLSDLARHDAKVGTPSRRLSAIKFAHQSSLSHYRAPATPRAARSPH